MIKFKFFNSIALWIESPWVSGVPPQTDSGVSLLVQWFNEPKFRGSKRLIGWEAIKPESLKALSLPASQLAGLQPTDYLNYQL